MTDTRHDLTPDVAPTAPRLKWQTPDFEVLQTDQTSNNGLVAPGDDIFSPSPTGS